MAKLAFEYPPSEEMTWDWLMSVAEERAQGRRVFLDGMMTAWPIIETLKYRIREESRRADALHDFLNQYCEVSIPDEIEATRKEFYEREARLLESLRLAPKP